MTTVLVLAGCLAAASGGEGEKAAVTPAARAAAPAASPAAATVAPIAVDVSHILVAFEGSSRLTATRSKQEALDLASRLARRARAGENFEDLAREHSDDRTAKQGGRLGIRRSDAFVKPFSEALLALEEGQISDPVETPFGFHVIRRNKLELVAARQILIMHNESGRAPQHITRTKADAEALANKIVARARAGEDFVALAREFSDADRAGSGGDMGHFGRGSRLPAVEEAAFALEVGQISDVIESRRGFHILQRYD